MIGFDDAVEIVRRAAMPLGTEAVRLNEAAGRVLAAPVAARIDSPRSDISAMDGYAVRGADLGELPARLKIVGQSFAGCGWEGELGPSECARIFTGAPLPKGADRVVIQEIVRREGDFAVIDSPPGKALHVRLRGGDFSAGDKLLAAGRRLDPRAITAAAAADVDCLQVFRRPRLRIIATGDELAEPGTAAGQPGTIAESVSFGIAALAGEWGGDVVGRSRLGDDLPAMQRAANAAAATADLVIVTGGASVGEKDFAKAMFAPAGLELLFSKVAIKPGKPVWLGRAGGALALGLPGNPTSALVTARLLLAPLLAGMTGRKTGEALRWRDVPLARALAGCGPRETFHRARLDRGKALVLSNQDSSAQKVLAEADLLVRQRADSPALEAGGMVEALDF